MAKIQFPDPRLSSPEGLVAYGGELTALNLIEAYKQGIFPWPQPHLPMLWFCPPMRGVIDFKDLRISQSLKKSEKKAIQSGIDFRFNSHFEQVIRACALAPRKDAGGTWITEEIVNGYTELFLKGHAWCMGAYRGEDLLAGIYGVWMPLYVTAESMFTHKTDLSKVCLKRAIQEFDKKSYSWVDIQMLTSVTESMGGRLIAREEFLDRISV